MIHPRKPVSHKFSLLLSFANKTRFKDGDGERKNVMSKISHTFATCAPLVCGILLKTKVHR